MDNQYAFDTAARHLMAQGQRCLGDGGCNYRKTRQASDPVRCAIGALIPDDAYFPEVEGKAVWQEAVLALLAKNKRLRLRRRNGTYPPQDTEFLRGLQEIHDERKPSEWRNKLAAFAKGHGLSDAVLREQADA